MWSKPQEIVNFYKMILSIFCFQMLLLKFFVATFVLLDFHYWSSHSYVFYKIDVLKNFEKFTGKHLCWSLFFSKIADLSDQTGVWNPWLQFRSYEDETKEKMRGKKERQKTFKKTKSIPKWFFKKNNKNHSIVLIILKFALHCHLLFWQFN